MTRINCIHPALLTDKHLLAEYRELPRVFALARPAPEAPKMYTMGKGHVLFFYDKLAWCYARQHHIVEVLKDRGFRPTFNPTDLWTTWYPQKSELWNAWKPTKRDEEINLQRIRERLSEKIPAQSTIAYGYHSNGNL